MLVKISPNDSRNISEDSTTLNFSDLYKLNKVKNIESVDTGSSISLGFDFKINNLDENNEVKNEKFRIGIGQIINAQENQICHQKPLNEKMSDIIGEASPNLSENIKISHNFLLDQNLENFNKNRIELGAIYPSTNFNLSF